MRLYEDQLVFVDALRAAMIGGAQGVIGQAATGFGKTQVASYIAKAAAEKGRRVYLTVHRKTLVNQTHQTFKAWGIRHGVIAAGHNPDFRHAVQIASIETLRRRLGKVPYCDLLIVDEAHLACSRTWTEVLNHYRGAGAKMIGFTATPGRLDGKPLKTHFDTIVCGPPMAELIENGRLSTYRMYAPSVPDLTKVRIKMGDYVTADIENLVHTQQLVGSAVTHYKKLMPGKRALAFCVSVKASLETVDQFRAGGISAEHMDGETPADERMGIIERLANGDTRVLSSCSLLSEGFDLAAQVGREVPVEGAILLRPTQSLVLYLQAVGRALRRKPEPAIILDHAGLALAHGLPDDAREWSLEGRPTAKPGETAIALRKCKGCLHIYRAFLRCCPICGLVPEKIGREVTTVEGDLVEVDVEQLRLVRKREEGMAKGVEELVRLARMRGYRPAWVAHRLVARSKGQATFAGVMQEVNRLW